jgi:hypothetical protein
MAIQKWEVFMEWDTANFRHDERRFFKTKEEVVEFLHALILDGGLALSSGTVPVATLEITKPNGERYL